MARSSRAREGVRRRAAVGLAGVACAALVASKALGDEEQFRVRYRAYDGCPGSGEFTRQVLARTTLARIAVGDAPAHTFDVTIAHSEDESESEGQLAIREPDGSRSERKVTAPSCAEVVEALALIAALTLDPSASTKPLPATPAPANKPVPAKPDALANAKLPGVPSKPRPAPIPTIAPTSVEVDRLRPKRDRIVGWSGADAIVTGGIGPNASLGIAMFLGIGRETERSLGWSARFGMRGAPAFVINGEPGSAQFQWLAGRLEGCPVRVRWGWLSAEPCAALEVGRLNASGIPDPNLFEHTHTRNATWIAGVAMGRLRADVIGDLGIELEGDVVVPFDRPEFIFTKPDTPVYVVYHVPLLAGSGALGLSMRFP